MRAMHYPGFHFDLSSRLVIAVPRNRNSRCYRKTSVDLYLACSMATDAGSREINQELEAIMACGNRQVLQGEARGDNDI